MAIKQATAVAVDPRYSQYTAIQTAPKVKNRETGEQKTDRRTGLQLWSVDCLRTESDGANAATVSVTIPSPQPPRVNGQRVSFSNLIALHWATETSSGLAFRADGVEATKDPAPSKSGVV